MRHSVLSRVGRGRCNRYKIAATTARRARIQVIEALHTYIRVPGIIARRLSHTLSEWKIDKKKKPQTKIKKRKDIEERKNKRKKPSHSRMFHSAALLVRGVSLPVGRSLRLPARPSPEFPLGWISGRATRDPPSR